MDIASLPDTFIMSHPLWLDFLSVTIFTLSLIPSVYANQWRRVFANADITSVYSTNCSNPSDFSDFHAVAAVNSYTPLRHIALCHTRAGVFFPKSGTQSLEDFKYRATEKSPRAKVVFIPVHQTMGYYDGLGWLKCEFFIYFSDRLLRPEFIFAHSILPRDAGCFKSAARRYVGTAKLFIFQEISPKVLSPPCLTCYPISFTQLDDVSLPNLRKLWDARNTNMHKSFAFVSSSVDVACGLLHTGFVNVDVCHAAVIAEKYNFTLLKYSGNQNAFHHPWTFGFAISRFFGETAKENSLYQVTQVSINFVTIANPPSAASGIATFVIPLDWETWTCLLTMIPTVAGFFALVELSGISWTSWIAVMTDKMITVASILLGQVGSSAGRAYRSGKIAFVLVILWLFGNNILTVNFYQGSIYSCMAVLFPPQTPGGIQDLVQWDVNVVAMDVVDIGPDDTSQTTLLDSIIPELVSNGGLNPKFTRDLFKFGAKLFPIYKESVRNLVSAITQENSARTFPTIAIFLQETMLENYVKFIKLTGNRHVVQNKGDTPFKILLFKHGSKTLLSPYFLKELRRLEESGFPQIWEKLNKISLLLQTKGAILPQKYFKAVQRSFGNLKEPVTFHESTPVSMELILPSFPLCGAVVAIAIIGFMVEKRKAIMHLGILLVVMIRQGLLRLGRKCQVFFLNLRYRRHLRFRKVTIVASSQIG